MEVKGLSLKDAAAHVIQERVLKGNAGLVAVSATGEVTMPFNTAEACFKPVLLKMGFRASSELFRLASLVIVLKLLLDDSHIIVLQNYENTITKKITNVRYYVVFL